MTRTRWAAAPFALWMVLFTVIPLGMVVYFAFTDSSGALKKISVGIEITLSMELIGTKVSIPINITIGMDVTAVGGAVTVVFPNDLDTYVLVEVDEPEPDIAAA